MSMLPSSPTRRQIHIAVAHNHDGDGCQMCHKKRHGGHGGTGPLATTAPATRTSSRSGSSMSEEDSYGIKQSGRPRPFSDISNPQLSPRSLSRHSFSAGLGGISDLLSMFTYPTTSYSPYTYVFSADVHPSTSPRVHYHHSASLSPSQIFAHAFGPPAAGYDFTLGGEGGREQMVDAWPDCYSLPDIPPERHGKAKGRNTQRRSNSELAFSGVVEPLSLDQLNCQGPVFSPLSTPPSTPASSISSFSSIDSPGSVDYAARNNLEKQDCVLLLDAPPIDCDVDSSPFAFGVSPPGSVGSDPACTTLDKPDFIFILDSPPIEMEAESTSFDFDVSPTTRSSLLPSTASDSGTPKRRVYLYRTCYHPLLRSEMPLPSFDPKQPTSPPHSPVSSPPSLSQARNLFSFSSLSISEPDVFGAGAAKALMDYEDPMPPQKDFIGWKRSLHAPLPPRERRRLRELEEQEDEELWIRDNDQE